MNYESARVSFQLQATIEPLSATRTAFHAFHNFFMFFLTSNIIQSQSSQNQVGMYLASLSQKQNCSFRLPQDLVFEVFIVSFSFMFCITSSFYMWEVQVSSG